MCRTIVNIRIFTVERIPKVILCSGFRKLARIDVVYDDIERVDVLGTAIMEG